MGCCWGQEDDEDVMTVELNTQTNAAVCCKSGKQGSNVNLTIDRETGNYVLKGEGTGKLKRLLLYRIQLLSYFLSNVVLDGNYLLLAYPFTPFLSRTITTVLIINNFPKTLVIGSCSLECDTAYWEIKLGAGAPGVSIGLKRFDLKKPVSLEGQLESKPEEGGWLLNQKDLGRDSKDKPITFKEGDVVGVHFDQTDFPMVQFTLNGELLTNASINRIRPANMVYASVSLKSGSSCELVFDGSNFTQKPIHTKYKMIVCATSLI